MMSMWDAVRQSKKGNSSAGPPRCSRCKRARVYDPCRDCATETELARTFVTSSRGKPVTLPYYPVLP